MLSISHMRSCRLKLITYLSSSNSFIYFRQIVHVPQEKLRKVDGMVESKRKVHLVHNEDSRVSGRVGSRRVETQYEIESNSNGQLNNSSFSNMVNSNRLGHQNVSRAESTVQMVPNSRLQPLPIIEQMP
jgi:hypothetical protein